MINQVLILSKPTILCLQKKIIIARLYFSSFASKICKLNIFLLKFSNRSLAPNFGVQKSVEQEIKLVWPNLILQNLFDFFSLSKTLHFIACSKFYSRHHSVRIFTIIGYKSTPITTLLYVDK